MKDVILASIVIDALDRDDVAGLGDHTHHRLLTTDIAADFAFLGFGDVLTAGAKTKFMFGVNDRGGELFSLVVGNA